MNSLILSRDYIPILKKEIKQSDLLYNHTLIENNSITKNCTSIVMTASNRSAQTYYTLKTIAASANKDVQVIIVDDSTNDPCLFEKLCDFPLYIDFININSNEKRWLNPCINYNIGFKYIKGSRIVIQNAEVCHAGDILNDLNNRISNNDNSYYVYDIITVKNLESNEILHNTPLEYDKIAQLPIYGEWYQSREKIRNLHFLVGLTLENFKKINCEFSYDYTFAFGWDDDDLLLKVIAANINIVNIHWEENRLMGIHQFHEPSPISWGSKKELGENLYNQKHLYYESTGEYIDLTENENNFDEKLALLMNAT